ncbi:MAG: TonB family protein [Candidatus Obscuribacterales bacterium]|nr:TonB family protein [Candidatus Obscuribacterales bacterium]
MIRQNNNEVVLDFPMMRDPKVASSLSLIPGLGQIYNSEPRKGLLFFMVALTNMVILAVLTFNKALISSLQIVGQNFNITPNRDIVDALSAYHAGSPACIVLLLLYLAFIAFSMRDAFDRAKTVRRNTIYPPCVMHISEAASGSYLVHNVLMATLVIFAFFFLLPAPPQVQITEIRFENPIQPTKTPPRTPNRAIIDADLLRSNRPRRENRQPGASAAAARPDTSRSDQPTRPKVENHSQPNKTESKPAPAKPQANPDSTQPVKTETKPPIEGPSMPLPVNKPVQPSRSNLTPLNPLVRTTAAAAKNDLPALTAPSNSPNILNNAAKLLNDLTPAAAPTKIASAFSPGQLTVKSGGRLAPPVLPGGQALSTPGTSVQPGVSESSTKRESGSIREPKGRDHGTGNREPAMAGGPGEGPSPKRSSTKSNDLASITGVKPDVGTTGDSKEPTQDNRKGCDIGGGKDKLDQNGSKIDIDYGPYMQQLQRRIRANWFPPKEFSTKVVLVRFAIQRNGTLSGLRLANSSGSSVADNAALKAVSNAAPFANLPKGAPESVDIEFRFDFHVYGNNGASNVFRRF